jgi:autotransporter-associated beta strand protein
VPDQDGTSDTPASILAEPNKKFPMKSNCFPRALRVPGGDGVSRRASIIRLCLGGTAILSTAASAAAPISIWDGGSIDNALWSTADNWDTAPVTGSDLVFAGEIQLSCENDLDTDFETGTPATFAVNSIVFSENAAGFYLTGRPLDLGAGKTITNNSPNLQAFGMPIQVDEDLTNGLVVNAAAGDVELNTLALRNGFNEFLDKTGPGTLIINGPLVGNDTFQPRVQQGTLITNASSNLFFNVNISAGATLRTNQAGNGVIHNGGGVTVNGVLDLAQGATEDVGNLSGSGIVTSHGTAGSVSVLGIRSSANNTFSGSITDSPDGGATSLRVGLQATSGSIFTAASKLTLTGANTYTGNTILGQNSGLVSLELSSTSSMMFKIGANNVNTKITGAFPQTTGTTVLNGSFNVDLSAAARVHNNSWTLVDVANLNETYGANFHLAAPFTESSPGVWTYNDGLVPSGGWTFTESTGVLMFQEGAGRPPVTTWDGGGADDLWSNAVNWDTPPLTNDDLIFDGNTQTTNTNDLDTDYDAGTLTIGAFVIDSIQFAPTAAAFTLLGNAIDYSNRTIVNNSPNTQTFNLQLQIDEDVGGLTVNAAAGDVVLNNLALRNGFNETLLKTGTHTLYVNGPLTGADTFAPQVNQGTMVASSSGNLFFGVSIASGATMRTGGAAVNGVIHNGGTVSVNGTLDLAEGVNEDIGNLNGSGVVTNQGTTGTTSTLRLRAGSNHTFSGSLQDSPSGGATALQLGLNATTVDAGIVTLSGANTHTGNTTFNQTTVSLVLADTGSMKFVPGANGVSNKIAAAAAQTTGTLTLNGTFNIDLIGAAIGNGNAWQLVDSTLIPTTTFGATFAVAGFTEASNVWTKVDGNNTWTFSEATGALSLAVAGAGGNFNTWANANGIAGQPASGDFDHDGLSNLVEYALGKSPTASSTPAGALASGVISFNKGAEAVANGDVTWAIQESDDLGVVDPWQTITPTVNNSSVISYTLPTGKPKVFVRLVVAQP